MGLNNVIRAAFPGTNLHGLIEGVAYFLWEKYHNKAELHWEEAKTIVQTYFDSNYDKIVSMWIKNDVGIGDCLETYLEKVFKISAWEFSDSGKNPDVKWCWERAKDKIAASLESNGGRGVYFQEFKRVTV